MDELHAYSMLWKMLEDFGAGEELPRRFPKFWSDVATAFLLSVAPNRRHYHSYNYDPEALHQVSVRYDEKGRATHNPNEVFFPSPRS
jgi:hypothetical protein